MLKKTFSYKKGNPSEEALQNRDNYEKVALMLFNQFWDNNILSLEDDGCLWDKMTKIMITETQHYNFSEKIISKICKTTCKQGNAKFPLKD